MPSGARMPHQGAPMGPPGPPYGGSPSVRPGMPNTVMEPTRKRPASSQQVQQQQAAQNRSRNAKRRKMADKILPQRQFVTWLRRPEGSVGVLRFHDQASFLFYPGIQEQMSASYRLLEDKGQLCRSLH
ncbi:UNVERIFIED_CONTAM: hypothetical protein FKN15_033930 [Acipenser sinensis]